MHLHTLVTAYTVPRKGIQSLGIEAEFLSTDVVVRDRPRHAAKTTGPTNVMCLALLLPCVTGVHRIADLEQSRWIL
jgi:hypothetical protein